MNYCVSELTESDIGALTDLVCSDCGYTFRVFGRPPAADDARAILTTRPPGADPGAKCTLGLWDGARLIGVADFVVGHPRAEILFVGLLQISPDAQGQGAGRILHDAILRRATAAARIRTLRLSLVTTNEHVANGFWRALEYSPGHNVTSWVRDDGLRTTARTWDRRVAGALSEGSEGDEQPG